MLQQHLAEQIVTAAFAKKWGNMVSEQSSVRLLREQEHAALPYVSSVQEHERAATRLRQLEEAAAEAHGQLQAGKAEADALAHKAARLRAEIKDAAAAAKRHRADEAAAAQVRPEIELRMTNGMSYMSVACQEELWCVETVRAGALAVCLHAVTAGQSAKDAMANAQRSRLHRMTSSM